MLTKKMERRDSMRKNRSLSLYLIALALFLAGTGYLLYAGFAEGSAYYLEVAEALSMPPEKLHTVKVFGTVRAEGLSRNGQNVVFLLQDKNNSSVTMPARYAGIIPEGFKPGAELIVDGSYEPQGKIFKVQTLITKCPSKYKKENRT